MWLSRLGYCVCDQKVVGSSLMVGREISQLGPSARPLTLYYSRDCLNLLSQKPMYLTLDKLLEKYLLII